MRRQNTKKQFFMIGLFILLSLFIIISYSKLTIAVVDPRSCNPPCFTGEHCVEGSCEPDNPTPGNTGTGATSTATSNLVYDVISSGAEWFVCNATGNAPRFGDLNTSNYLPNFGTLSDTALKAGNKWCSFVPNHDEIEDYLFVQSGSGYGSCAGDSRFKTTYDKCCVIDDTYSNIEKCNNGDPDCDPWSYFQGTNPDSCPVCYDESGDPITNNNPSNAGTQSSSLIPKGSASSFGSFPGNSRRSCQGPVNNGFLCRVNETCKEGYNVIASSDSTVCCSPGGSADACVSFKGDENLFCVDDLGGELIPNPNNNNPGVNCKLIVKSKDTTNDLVCCKSGLEPPNDFGGVDFDKFICYQENNNSLFGECCIDDSCDNEPANNQFDNFSIFTGGTPLHTINSFDVYDQTLATPVDYVSKESKSSDVSIFPRRDINWSKFDTLNFDFAYSTTETAPDNFSIKFSDNTLCGPYSIPENTIYNFSKLPEIFSYPPNKWFRIVVDISACTNLGKEAERLIFHNDKQVSFYFDNFYLSKSSDIGTNNGLDTKFCSAAAKKWVNSLNPANFVLSDFSTWGAESYACDQQLSMSWSGSHCCGSTTQRANYGEYYPDLKLGCFAGFPVDNNKRVSDALGESNNQYFSKLLYYNNEFYACNTTIFDNLNKSLDGRPTSERLVTHHEGYYSVKGKWYCDPAGWLNLTQANNLPIIAATLKQIGEDNSATNYSLHCGNESVLNTPISPHSKSDEIPVANYCVLRTKDSVVIGVPVDYSTVNDFLNKNLKSFHPLYKEPGSYNCTVFTKKFNTTNFYQPCSDVSDWLNATYNKPFGILLFSMKDDGLPNNAFLKYVTVFWNSIKDFFKSLFGITTPTNAMSIPGSVEDFSFKELYINKVGMKVIKGVRDKDTIVVKYINFSSDMSFLKDLTKKWLDDNGGVGNVYFNKSTNLQTIKFNGATAQKFNWNYLTSNLRVKP